MAAGSAVNLVVSYRSSAGDGAECGGRDAGSGDTAITMPGWCWGR